LGAHGAWLLAPYEDLPTSVGLNTSSIESIEETARLAAENDFQLCVHAIGDKANQAVLDIFQAEFERSPSAESRRWRVEHAQHLDPADIPRFAQLGVIASMQGIHCTSDAVFVMQRLGARRAQGGAYVWKSLLDSGAIICNGTDAPVEPVDPIASYYASVTRRLPNGVTFFPEQCMTREQALRSYTLDAAYAAFEENEKGSLTSGKMADMVVLSGDIMSCPEDEIRQAQVVATIVGGKIEYQNDELWNR
jgi:predicted amidohydrolase YtcJ